MAETSGHLGNVGLRLNAQRFYDQRQLPRVLARVPAGALQHFQQGHVPVIDLSRLVEVGLIWKTQAQSF